MANKIIGYGLISSPFIGIFIASVIKSSLVETIGIFLFSGAIIAAVYIGVHLISED